MALTHWVSAGDVPRFRAAMESLGTPLDTDDQLLDALEKQFGFGGDLVKFLDAMCIQTLYRFDDGARYGPEDRAGGTITKGKIA